MKDVLKLEKNKEAIDAIEKSTGKGDKMLFLTQENNFERFYQKVVENMYTDEQKELVGFVKKDFP